MRHEGLEFAKEYTEKQFDLATSLLNLFNYDQLGRLIESAKAHRHTWLSNQRLTREEAAETKVAAIRMIVDRLGVSPAAAAAIYNHHEARR